MQDAVSLVIHLLEASWSVLLDAAPFVLLGFFVAGLLKAFVPDDFVSTHLGGNGFGSILKASAIGIPIPLCSCGVLPAAAGLQKQGAGKGPVASFLISTPETGVDSIAVSYALLDPLMAVVRPVAGFLTALAAGLAVSVSERIGTEPDDAPLSKTPSACTSSCCCGHAKPVKKTLYDKLRAGMHFAFGDLLKDVGAWLFLGVLIAGTITTFISPETIDRFFSNELFSMAFMFAVSVPLYVCATASTPVAAAFALKGISPGAALVFLLAGPATNAASLTVIARLLGKRATTIYLAVVVLISFGAGFLVNHLYVALGLDIRHWVSQVRHEEATPVAIVSAVILAALVVKSSLPSRRVAHSH